MEKIKNETSGKLEKQATEILQNVFNAQTEYAKSGYMDLGILEAIFHQHIVIHEPSNLPYSGDWKGIERIGKLFKLMQEFWSNMQVTNTTTMMNIDTIFVQGTLIATARKTSRIVNQPFAEVLKIEDGLIIKGTPFYFDTAEIGAIIE